MLAALLIAMAPVSAPVAAEAQIIAIDPVVVPGGGEGARRLLVRITAPVVGRHLPVILLTHGNRLSREDYRPLVDAWAQAGHVVIQPDHADAATDGVPPAANPPGMWRSRVEDVHRTLDALPAILRQVPGLKGRVDVRKVAIAGHSLGGLTAMMIDGARPKWDVNGMRIADIRIKATLLLAPTGDGADLTPAWKTRSPYVNVDFATLRGAVLVVAGGADDPAPMARRGAAWRQDPYRLAPAGTACMVVVAGAGHYLGGINGAGMAPAGDARPERLALVRDATIRFLHTALKGEGASFRDWLPTLATRPAAESAGCR